jgi:hypothetical protein
VSAKVLRTTFEQVNAATPETDVPSESPNRVLGIGSVTRGKGVYCVATTPTIHPDMKSLRRQASDRRNVVPAIGSLGKEAPTGPQDAQDLPEDTSRVIEVLQHVIGHDDVETRVGIRYILTEARHALVEKRVVSNPEVRIDATNAPEHAAEVHLRDDSGPCPEIETFNLCSVWSHGRENRLAK